VAEHSAKQATHNPDQTLAYREATNGIATSGVGNETDKMIIGDWSVAPNLVVAAKQQAIFSVALAIPMDHDGAVRVAESPDLCDSRTPDACHHAHLTASLDRGEHRRAIDG
jgi:hypothetical protein